MHVSQPAWKRESRQNYASFGFRKWRNTPSCATSCNLEMEAYEQGRQISYNVRDVLDSDSEFLTG